MADLIDIEFGDQRIRVPAWATESTLEAMLKYNEIAARALNKLVYGCSYIYNSNYLASKIVQSYK